MLRSLASSPTLTQRSHEVANLHQNRGLRRLHVSLDEIRAHDRELADGLLNQPFDFSQAFNQALYNVVKALPNRPSNETTDDSVRD